MNREILFKAKCTDNGEWVEGYYVYFKSKKSSRIYHLYKGALLVTNVDSKTVCQYTGLDDKNGRKIFEGDIFCIHDKNTFSVSFINGSFTVIPTYEIAKKIIRRKYLDEFARLSGYIEVIGNIFDNPGLLA